MISEKKDLFDGSSASSKTGRVRREDYHLLSDYHTEQTSACH
jgi:hypothetical protein